MKPNKKNYLSHIAGMLIILVLTAPSCTDEQADNNGELAFSSFKNPPSDSRPFVRWWWNGNRITTEEITRQLDVLHAAGIGGVEINPIAMPGEADLTDDQPLTWLSKEWNEKFAFAATEAKKRGMITDMIVGSGWPFGGEFLKEDETIQRVIVNKIRYSEGDKINETPESLYKKALDAQARRHAGRNTPYFNVLFIDLVPTNVSSIAQISDLKDDIHKKGVLQFDVPKGQHELVYGILQRSHRTVLHGAPGAAGPVLNHYDREVTLAYLNRLKKLSEDIGIPLSELVRALFCDSIELSGANWTDDFQKVFYNTYHYRLEPYFPYIFYQPLEGYEKDELSAPFKEEIKRVRYDYNKLLVKIFLDNFTRTFQEFCTENGVLCRYQAYGGPFLMGIMEGNMIPDIPESNNWLFVNNMDSIAWNWNQKHGYMIWNLYAASGGHLTGRKIISCEAMTNTAGVFRLTLEDIKQHDDMNFITGINHSVLHGYNYSPESVRFPGWIRYGSYFSERNTWWKYFPEWVNYNARLSYVFQNSQAMKSIAILGPTGDIWSNYGLSRAPLHTDPWYCYRLWEPVSQSGSSCDYISEEIIQNGTVKKGKLTYGKMSYQAIFLSSVESLEASTAKALQKFVHSGGKLVVIDKVPVRSLSYQNAEADNQFVNDIFKELQQNYPDRVLLTDSPASEKDLLPWTRNVLINIALDKDVKMNNTFNHVYQIRKKSGKSDIYFFTNSHKTITASFDAEFPTGGKTPWIWNPEDGTKSVFPFGSEKHKLTIQLDPLQSLLLVFDSHPGDKTDISLNNTTGQVLATVEGPWKVRFEHTNGETFTRVLNELTDLGNSNDPQLNAFAGTITYSTEFFPDETARYIQLENAKNGITELFINGKPAGLNWYGKPLFKIDASMLQEGANKLEVKYTSLLYNYVKSLKGNPTAERWSRGRDYVETGITGAIIVLQDTP